MATWAERRGEITHDVSITSCASHAFPLPMKEVLTKHQWHLFLCDMVLLHLLSPLFDALLSALSPDTHQDGHTSDSELFI